MFARSNFASQEAPKDVAVELKTALSSAAPEIKEVFSMKPGIAIDTNLNILKIFEKVVNKDWKSIKLSGKEYAILADLQILRTDKLKDPTYGLKTIENNIFALRESTILKRFAPWLWELNMKSLREQKMIELSKRDRYEVTEEEREYFNSQETFGKARAAILYSVLNKLGNHEIPKIMPEIAASSNAVLSVFDQALDRMSFCKIDSKARKVLENIKETIKTLGDGALKYTTLIKAAKKCNEENNYREVNDALSSSVFTGLVVLGVLSFAAVGFSALTGTIFASEATILAVAATAAIISAFKAFRSESESKYPFINIARKLRRFERMGLLSVGKEGLNDVIPFPKEPSPQKSEKKTLDFESSIADIQDISLKTCLTGLLNEKTNLDRTLTLVGHSKCSPAIDRALDLLNQMLERYTALLPSDPESSADYAKKIVTSAESISEHIRGVNKGIKNSLDREFTSNAEAIKAIVSPL